MKKVRIIGAGLAGSEAAWQCARRGVAVELFEMRPARRLPLTRPTDFAELVCSNSLKSESENTAPWLLKEEMRRAGSRLLEIARETAVPAGHALAVDRDEFSKRVTEAISREPLITVRREEVTQIEDDQLTVIATGPLTSDALSQEIVRLSSAAAMASTDAGVAQSGAPLHQSLFLRFHQPDRRSRFHRHGARCTWRPATTRVRPTTSIVRCRRRSTTSSTTRCSLRSRSIKKTGRT